MLHTKFQGHWSIGSGEDVSEFLSYMGVAAILVMWPRPFEQLFVPKGPGGCMKFDYNLPSSFRDLEIVDGGRMEPAYTSVKKLAVCGTLVKST